MNPNTLQHWGIKGQRWGIRRFQRKDGSLTPEGKRRYDDLESDSEEHVRARSKSTRTMTDAELQSAVRRLEMEKRYNDLNPRHVSAGEKIGKAILKASGEVALNVGKNLATDALTRRGKSLLGLSDGDEFADLKREVEGLRLRSQRNNYMRALGMVVTDGPSTATESKSADSSKS